MQFDWTFPYATKRIPVFAKNVVATSQPLAVQAGIDASAVGATRSMPRWLPRSR